MKGDRNKHETSNHCFLNVRNTLKVKSLLLLIKMFIITVDPSSILTESLLRELGYYQFKFMTSISIPDLCDVYG